MTLRASCTLNKRSRMLLFRVSVFFMLLPIAGFVQAQPPAVPLPPDVAVEAPGSDVSADLRRFSGVWGNGAWNGVLATLLVVEQVKPDGQARVVYAMGDAPQWNITRGSRRLAARIESGTLKFQTPWSASLEYWFDGELLKGAYTWSGGTSTVRLTRTALADVTPKPKPVHQVATDKEIIGKLISSSPWAAKFGFGERGPQAGSATFVFSFSDGKLKGEMTSFEGRGTARPGPLEKVELKDGRLSFVTPSNGVYYELRFEGEELKGWWSGTATGWLEARRGD